MSFKFYQFVLDLHVQYQIIATTDKDIITNCIIPPKSTWTRNLLKVTNLFSVWGELMLSQVCKNRVQGKL